MDDGLLDLRQQRALSRDRAGGDHHRLDVRGEDAPHDDELVSHAGHRLRRALRETAETWTRRFTWTASGVDVPLANATATFTVKPDIDGAAILTLSSGSGITLADGVIDISITDAQIRTALAGLTVTKASSPSGSAISSSPIPTRPPRSSSREVRRAEVRVPMTDTIQVVTEQIRAPRAPPVRRVLKAPCLPKAWATAATRSPRRRKPDDDRHGHRRRQHAPRDRGLRRREARGPRPVRSSLVETSTCGAEAARRRRSIRWSSRKAPGVDVVRDHLRPIGQHHPREGHGAANVKWSVEVKALKLTDG